MAEQSKLFPEVDTFAIYEQPLNERIRSCLRLEHLFSAVEKGRNGDTEWDSREALAAMVEVGDLISRTDIKGELIKELERCLAMLGGLRSNPAVDQQALEETIASISPLVSGLKQSKCQPGATLRRDELITQFKQRVAIPGGTCSFDLPAFHYWLQKEPDDRAAQIRRWGEDLEIINDAVSHILRMLRDSTEPTLVQATSGFYQQQIDPSYQCQLIRVFISDNLDTFPEISGGKHRFSVRFLRQTDTLQRPEQIDENVSFEVQCCSI